MQTRVPDYLVRWGLTADGPALSTPSSELQPVRVAETAARAMLKIPLVPEEALGCRVLEGWPSSVAARVLRADDGAALIEWAGGPHSLDRMSRTGHDDEATAILARAVLALHAAPNAAVTAGLTLPTLHDWFSDLRHGAERLARVDRLYDLGAATAAALLADDGPGDITLLHGDIHHGNVLDTGSTEAAAWRVIDPKGITGHRAFDYVNILSDPDWRLAREFFNRRVAIIADVSGLSVECLCAWSLATETLSAAWFHDDGMPEDAAGALSIARLAAARL